MGLHQVIPLMGQSNVIGQATTAAALSTYSGYEGETDVYCASQLQCNNDSRAAQCAYEWAPSKLCYRSVPTLGQFGPELGIGRAIPRIKSHGDVLIVRCGTGATDLANEWAHDAGDTGFALWNRAKDFVTDAADGFFQAGRWKVAGVIWVQGEADAAIEAEANAYQANLQALIAASRVEWGDGTPWAIARLNDDSDRLYKVTVQTAQDAVGAADPLVTVVSPNDAPSIPLGADNNHYDSDEICALGLRLGAAIDAYTSICR